NYAGMLATLVGAVSTTQKENEYFFRKDIIFSTKSFAAMAADNPLAFSTTEMIQMALRLIWGVLTFRVRIRTITALLKAMKNGEIITNLYAGYPDRAEDFDAWVQRANEVWAKTPGMADVIDPDKD
ncbi:MAG: hypothetical protein V1761_03070, partial [bacterium]